MGKKEFSGEHEEKVLPDSPIVVFFDTGPLLTMWTRWWKGEQIDDPCFTDTDIQRVTSHKCVAEMHNIFRGRANKGDGERQAKVLKFLGPEYKAATPRGLAERLGIDDNEAKFLYAQTRWQQPPDPTLMSRFMSNEDIQRLQARWEANQSVRDAVRLHRELFAKVDEFLHQYHIRVMHVSEVFAPCTLGDWYSFVEESIIRSEDLEIIFAAEVAHADLFITEDEELISDSLTLGEHGHDVAVTRPLMFANFWRKDQYKMAREQLMKRERSMEREQLESEGLHKCLSDISKNQKGKTGRQ